MHCRPLGVWCESREGRVGGEFVGWDGEAEGGVTGGTWRHAGGEYSRAYGGLVWVVSVGRSVGEERDGGGT